MALPKIYDKSEHQWHNNTTPSINEDELNAISGGLSDLDDRVIGLASDLMEKVPLILEKYDDIETLSENPPYIGSNGNWFVWDTSTNPPGYADSGIDASITVQIADITILAPDAAPYVTNTGTATDPVFHLYIPRGPQGLPGADGSNGSDGADGVSPIITITDITGGHRVTITDADHPSGQSFDVLDGSGTGDMQKSVYDSNSTVSTAGGIVAYVTNAISNLLSKYSSGSSDWDTAPTSASTKPVTSGGVYSNTVKAISAGTATNVGGIRLSVTKAGLVSNVDMEVGGWDSFVGKWTEEVTKSAGSTSCAITNPMNSTDINVEPFCENSNGTNVTINSISVTASTITLNFGALAYQTKFKAKVTLKS